MVSPAVVRRLMEGAIDFHVHAAPDPYKKRRLDALDLANESKEAGLKAVVLKNHQFGTALVAGIVNKIIPDFSLIGSLTLNKETGGLNPDVVEAAAVAGTKVIWMPTTSSVLNSKEEQGISLLDENKRLLPAVTKILDIIKANDMVLGTGHISLEEIYALAQTANKLGVKVTLTHPLLAGFGCSLTLRQQQELVSMGGMIEHCFVACMPALGGMNPKTIADYVKAVGEEYCILSTDFGQAVNPSPTEGFKMMVENMLRSGLSEKTIETLVKTNPSRILGLDSGQ